MSDSLLSQLVSDLQTQVRRLEERVRDLERERSSREREAKAAKTPKLGQTGEDYWRTR